MGANVSRDGEDDQAAHPMRLARLGSRPTNVPSGLDNAFIAARLNEHSFAPPHPHHTDVRFVQHRSPVQRSGIVANVVNLDKSSLRVVPAPDDARVLCLEFQFTANVPGFVAVYYAARRMVHRAAGVAAPVRKVSYVPLDVGQPRKPEKTRFDPGSQLQYRQKAARGLPTHHYPEHALTEVVDGQYPVVIRIEARHNAKGPKRSRVTSQSTYAVLTRSEAGWGIKVVSQEVLIGGTIYVVQELYGIGAVDVTASRSDELAEGTGVPDVFEVDKGNECVICLTDAANTAVLPCNHLCLCQECGKKLSEDPAPDRRRCPICRTEIESLLRIIPTSLSSDQRRAAVCDQPSQQSLEVEPVSSGEGDALDVRAVAAAGEAAASASTTAVQAKAKARLKVEDEASMSSEVSDSSSRDEDGAVVTLRATAGTELNTHDVPVSSPTSDAVRT